jgi:hypothetical protein
LERKKKRRAVGITAVYSANPVGRRSRDVAALPNHKRLGAGQRTLVDREIAKLFRPTWLSLVAGSKAHHTPAGVEQLVQAERHLARVLDFGRLDLGGRLERREEEAAGAGYSIDPAWRTVRQRLQGMDPASLTELACPGAAAEGDEQEKPAPSVNKTYSR